MIGLLSIAYLNGLIATPLQPFDSVGVKSVNGKKFIEHKIEAHEGWYSIARKYGISYSDLRIANKDSSDKLSVGQIILVPTDKGKINDPRNQKNYILDEDKTKDSGEPVYHTVKAKETLFAIAKKYHVTADEIKKWNQLSSGNLKKGDKIIVGYKKSIEKDEIKKTETKKEETKSEVRKTEIRPDSLSAKSHHENKSIPESENKKNAGAGTRKQVSEQGVATWIDDENINPNKYFALHRTASVGSIIKVTNRMNKRTIFVKVVGKLPDTGDNENVIIKISKASAEKLGVRDQRFQCELAYGVTEK